MSVSYGRAYTVRSVVDRTGRAASPYRRLWGHTWEARRGGG
jgi:hypothetical protein